MVYCFYCEAPLWTPAKDEHMYYFTENGHYPLPVPPPMHNEGNYIISLGDLCRWMGEQAEELGVEIYPGFAASEILFDEEGTVKGIATGDMGLNKDGTPGDNFARGEFKPHNTNLSCGNFEFINPTFTSQH